MQTLVIDTNNIVKKLEQRGFSRGQAEGITTATEAIVGIRVVSAPGITSGLMGYWSFNDGAGTTATDFSGHGNTGTLTNGPAWTNGKLGQALSFDGVDDSVVTASSLESLLGLAHTATLALWIRTTQTGNDADWQAPGITGIEESGG